MKKKMYWVVSDEGFFLINTFYKEQKTMLYTKNNVTYRIMLYEIIPDHRKRMCGRGVSVL